MHPLHWQQKTSPGKQKPHSIQKGHEAAKAHGFDPADYVMPTDVAALLDDGWHVDLDERRLREVPVGAGSEHTHDVVLRARRLTEAS